MKKGNKKGFTLVELLAVIVILGLVAVIAAPLVLGTINSSKDSLSKEQQNRLIESAKLYAAKEDIDDCKWVSAQTLHQNGYLEKAEVTDPKTGAALGGVEIKWGNNNQYEYKYEPACTCGC